MNIYISKASISFQWHCFWRTWGNPWTLQFLILFWAWTFHVPYRNMTICETNKIITPTLIVYNFLYWCIYLYVNKLCLEWRCHDCFQFQLQLLTMLLSKASVTLSQGTNIFYSFTSLRMVDTQYSSHITRFAISDVFWKMMHTEMQLWAKS